jgi:putative membrane protein
VSENILARWGYGGGWGGGWGGGPWWGFAPWWGIGTLVVLAAVAGVVVYLVRRQRFRQFGPPPGAGVPLSAAEDVLARRFAAGEISEEEYVSRLAVLRRPN